MGVRGYSPGMMRPPTKSLWKGSGIYFTFYAKKARGMMADFVVRKRITDPTDLKKFKTADYQFSKGDSSDMQLFKLKVEERRDTGKVPLGISVTD